MNYLLVSKSFLHFQNLFCLISELRNPWLEKYIEKHLIKCLQHTLSDCDFSVVLFKNKWVFLVNSDQSIEKYFLRKCHILYPFPQRFANWTIQCKFGCFPLLVLNCRKLIGTQYKFKSRILKSHNKFLLLKHRKKIKLKI